MNGWFAMRRELFRHPIFNRRPDRVAVWSWILATAAWRDTKLDAGGTTVVVRRGQLLTSFRQMSDATGVGIKVIRTLLDRLTTEHAIDIDMGTGRMLITICNYDKYQTASERGAQEGAREGHGLGTEKEQGNNIPVGAGDKLPPSEPVEITTVTAALWNVGKRYLSHRGVEEPGRLIGKWLKQSGGVASTVLAAIEAAQKAETQDPVPYISAIILAGSEHTIGQPGASAGAFGFIPEVG